MNDTRAGHVLAWLAVVGATFGVRATWLAADVKTLVSGPMADDAFYYFEIARRIRAGQGMTFDGFTPATGLHIMWLGAVLPFFSDTDMDHPVRKVVWLATACIAVAGLCLYAFLSRFVPGRIAALLAVSFVAHPWIYVESLNGLETALAIALVCALLACCQSYILAPTLLRARFLGFLGALAVLTRSDLSLGLAVVCLVWLYRRAPIPHVASAFGPALAALIALSCVNYVRTGYLLQSSATAVPMTVRAAWHRDHPRASAWETFRFGLRQEMDSFRIVRKWLGLSGSILLGVTAGLALAWTRGQSVEQRAAIPPLLALFAGLLLLHGVHGFVRWLPRTWYFVYWVILLYALAGLALSRLQGHLRPVLLLALVVPELCRLRLHADAALYPHQSALYLAGVSVRSLAGRIGSFNAGIIAYVSGRDVVNLDGVVNEDAARSIRASTLGEYVKQTNIQYLLDFPIMWSFTPFPWSCASYLGEDFRWLPPQVVARFNAENSDWGESWSAVALRRLDWEGARWNGVLSIQSADSDARAYLGEGLEDRFDGSTARIVWSQATAEWRVPMLAKRAYRVDLALASPVRGGMAVSVNGTKLGTFALTGGRQRVRVVVPGPCVRNRSRLILRGSGLGDVEIESILMRPTGAVPIPASAR